MTVYHLIVNGSVVPLDSPEACGRNIALRRRIEPLRSVRLKVLDDFPSMAERDATEDEVRRVAAVAAALITEEE